MGMTLQEIKELDAYHLADMADCADPDTQESPGALMLISIRDSVVSAIEGGFITLTDIDDSGQLHEIADNAPSVYTHPKWQQFLDLCAYQEEPDDGEWPTDLDRAASCALYQIADRLAHSLAEEWRDGWECPECGDTGAPHVCYPGDCRGEDEEKATYAASLVVPAEAVLTGPVDLPADPFRGHPDYAGEDWQRDYASPVSAVLNAELDVVMAREVPVSDPILDLITAHERQSPGDETSRFLANMAKVNELEFASQRRRRWARWVFFGLALAGLIIAYVVI